MKQDIGFGVQIEVVDRDLVEVPKDKTGLIIDNKNGWEQYL